MGNETMTALESELRKYLIGDLPESSVDQIDARLFAEDELIRDLEFAQDSLIEDFLAGRLTTEEEAKFQIQIARSPLLQQKVEFMRVLFAALENGVTNLQQPSPSFRARLTMFLVPSLAALLCVISFLYLRESRKNAGLNPQLQARSYTPQTVSPRTVPSFRENPPGAVAFLSAGLMRGASGLPGINVSPNDALMELQVELRNPPAGESTWDAELLRGSNLIWRSSKISLRTAGHEKYLSLFIKSRVLQPGDYEIHYKPSSSAQNEFQVRAFRVSQRR